jgi:hypothetical protein
MSRCPPTPRSRILLERVHHALGANALRERWIEDKHGVEGLAEPGVITISPLGLVETILHESLHRAHPEWAEVTIQRTTSYLWHRISDDDARRVYDTYAAKVKRMKRPTTSD